MEMKWPVAIETRSSEKRRRLQKHSPHSGEVGLDDSKKVFVVCGSLSVWTYMQGVCAMGST